MTVPQDRRPATGSPPAEDGEVLAPDRPAPSGSSGRPRRGGRVPRFRSVRRVPAALLALVVLAAAGPLLYDLAAVRAGRPRTRWHRVLVRELSERPLHDVWVLTGAAAAVAAGLWLLALALAPGLRGLLPMRRDRSGLRAGIDRPAAALVLRDRAVEVSGVRSVRVRMGRKTVRVHAVSHFRDLDEVRADLGTALAAGLAELGLAGRPAMTLRVRRPTRKG